MNHLGVGQQQKKTVVCNNTEVQLVIPQQPQNIQYTRQPHVVYCANCNNQIQTHVQLKIGKGQLMMALIMLPKLLCACVIPLLMDDCRDAVHLCPVCKAEVGRKNFIFE
ncbi:unnamed protein product (macronuclear) [Paramecium tetraurelia]|uniref:LITAF domain-containing protein n=1 Tax=Paramecium tetraurelia TaxID=5888 RepID=A0DK62_PARTE|nr:uncharacterized protein GSPATT00017758001 [Paramecium tetraurelia]CAK83429.1 unnamed protein product [Paramecium tetraurelia]|eukprot:XP_001450826.1 hypothetical protein (macronuclear) [Paramecium tetraurelia strain d4-2]